MNVASPTEVLKTTNFERMMEISKIIRKSQTITYVPEAVAHTQTFLILQNES